MQFLKSLFERPLIGLDIGVSGIKAVELSGGKEIRLLGYNRMPLPWDSITPDGEVKKRDIVVQALKRLFDSGGFSSKRVAVGAGSNSIITKKITVTKMSPKELSEQLYWEAEQYIPYSIQDVNVDFAILGPNTSAQSATPMMDVLLVAAKKDYVSYLIELVRDAGLKPEVVDNQAFALGNAFELNYGALQNASSGHVHVIIDFGAGSTKVSVVDGDKTTFTRQLRQSGMAYTEALAERLEISLEEAERLKVMDAGSDGVKTVLSEFNGLTVDEISRTLDYCASQNPDKSIQGVYICGGAAQTLGLLQEMESRLPVPVQFFNPVQNVLGSGKKMNAKVVRELALLGGVAIGLALRKPGDVK